MLIKSSKLYQAIRYFQHWGKRDEATPFWVKFIGYQPLNKLPPRGMLQSSNVSWLERENIVLEMRTKCIFGYQMTVIQHFLWVWGTKVVLCGEIFRSKLLQGWLPELPHNLPPIPDWASRILERTQKDL